MRHPVAATRDVAREHVVHDVHRGAGNVDRAARAGQPAWPPTLPSAEKPRASLLTKMFFETVKVADELLM
jgi:hypothetical protein